MEEDKYSLTKDMKATKRIIAMIWRKNEIPPNPFEGLIDDASVFVVMKKRGIYIEDVLSIKMTYPVKRALSTMTHNEKHYNMNKHLM